MELNKKKMRKIILVFLFMFPALMWANSYSVDFENIDRTIEDAIEINDFQIQGNAEFAVLSELQSEYQFTDKSATTALVLGLVLGYSGIHRLYLGTTVGVFVTYFITGAGCGVLYTVDNLLLLIALLESSPIDRYIDNPHFFMWME